MANDPGIIHTLPADDTWQDVEELVDRIDQLSRQELPIREFYTALLDGAVQTLAARAGAVWLADTKGRLHVEYQIGLSRVGLDPRSSGALDGNQRASHERLVETAARNGAPNVVPPDSGSAAAGESANPTEQVLLLCPITLDGESLGVLEIFQRPETSRSAQQGFLRFLGALGELAAEFHRNRRGREMRDRSTLWGQFQQFAERVHGSLDVESTAFVLANEGRRLIGCDRLSVAVRSGSRFRLRAVSGLDTVNRRANAVRRLEKLMRAVTATEEPLWYTGQASDLPPQIDAPLNAYLDESHARMLAVIPLFPGTDESAAPAAWSVRPLETDAPHARPSRRRRPDAVLIAEQFESSQAGDALRQRVNAVCRQSAPAIRNALEHHSIPFLPLLKLLRSFFRLFGLRRLPKTAAAIAVVTAAVLALVLIPVDFEISGTGELQPEIRRDVFATSDGVVREVLVEHKSEVSAEDVVVRLRNSDLDFKLSQVLGEINTTQKDLDTVQISLRSTSPDDPDEQVQYNQLAAREVELKEELKNLTRQLGILKAQAAELDVHSPIDGQVLTWDLHKTLDARPVERGQVLMTVADVDGPWVVEIKVADEHIGHVLGAQRELGRELKVEFMVAAEPGVTHTGTVQSIRATAEPMENEGPVVLVTVRFDKQHVPRLRPGASVVPHIYCGRRSVGYVWFHELFEAVQRRLLF